MNYKMNIQKLGLVIFILSLSVSLKTECPNGLWLNNLVTYIKEDFKASQVLLIVDNDNNTSMHTIINVIQKMQFLPINIISLKNATLQQAKKMSKNAQFNDLQSTTFVLTMLSIKNKEFSKFVDLSRFLTFLHSNKTRTKCLTIIFCGNEQLTYRNFLHHMWLNDFLDFTIISIHQNETNITSLDLIRSVNVKVHQYNPFTKVYKVKNYTNKKLKIFVNKLKNMNGFEMKVGTIHFPPFVFVKRNSTGYPVKISGVFVKITREFKEKMNFTIAEVPLKEESLISVIRIGKNKSPSLINQLLNKKIRYITNWVLYSEKRTFSRTRVIDFDRFCALIPAPKNESLNWSKYYKLSWIYFFIIILIVKALISIMKFDKQLWTYDYILRLILGITVPKEPQNAREKSAFIFMLIAFMVFSFSIFAILLDATTTMGPMEMIDTLGKLNGTNLTPMMRQQYVVLLSNNNDPVIRDLLKKSLNITIERECVQMLIEYRNVTCFLRQTMAEFFIQQCKNSPEITRLKIVDETFNILPEGMILEAASPFVNEFNKIISILLESGVITHWMNQTNNLAREIDRSINPTELSSSILIPLMYILLIGYCASFFVFVGEMVLNYLKRVVIVIMLKEFFSGKIHLIQPDDVGKP